MIFTQLKSSTLVYKSNVYPLDQIIFLTSGRTMKFPLAIIALFVAVNAYSDESAWIEFKNEHQKQYKLVEEKFRFQVFQNSLRKIEAHNERYEKGEVSYFLKVTPFADWTEEEFKSLLARQAASKPTYNDTLGTFVHDPTVAAPSSLDWRDKNAVLPVKNQNSCGACYTFSCTGALEGQLAIHQNKHISLSEQELVDCSRSVGNIGCGGGDQVPTFNYVKDHGIGSEDDYPYIQSEGSCKKVKKVISGLSGVKRVEKNEKALISAIASIGPIAVSADATTWSLYGGGVYNNQNCGKTLNHAILAVGYTEQYLIVKNSWGTSWGEKGYIKIARGHNVCRINDDNSYPVL